MTVVHFVGALNHGGVCHLIINQSQELIRRGHTVFFLVFGKQNHCMHSEIYGEVYKKGIKVVFLDKNYQFPFMKYFNRVNSLKKFLEHNKIDILHMHLDVIIYYILSRISGRNFKVFYTFHSDIKRTLNDSHRYYKWSVQFCLRKRDLIPIAITRKIQMDVNRYFNINYTRLLYNCVDLDKFLSVRNSRSQIKEEVSKNGYLILGHVGRMSKIKNHEFMIEMAEMLKQRGTKFEFWFIGEGERELELKEYIKEKKLEENIKFWGTKNNIEYFLAAMDVFVFPSILEGFGLAVLEAQAVGIPCIISKGVPAEVVISSNVSILSLSDGTEKWVNEVMKVVNKKADVVCEIEKFSIKKNVDELLKIYT